MGSRLGKYFEENINTAILFFVSYCLCPRPRCSDMLYLPMFYTDASLALGILPLKNIGKIDGHQTTEKHD